MAGIPLSYIVHRLHGLADHFWTRPESADCTVIVPLPIAPVPSSANGFGTRRGSARFAGAGDRNPRHADSTSMRRLTFRLHKDYLSTQSTLFRQFLSSATPLDLDTGCTTPPDGSFLPLLNPFGQPRLLSSNPDNPTLFLPLPDPSSFTILLHYLYHGDFEVVARSMSQKKVRWEGVVMNADFLGLDEVLKNELGVWWRRNISPLA
ncbi:hypothetical protein IE53DRAFT_304038, partial [Violaceomyces palustris]